MPTLNADVGELEARVRSGADDALIAVLDDANVACGGHAGDDETMAASVRSCLRHGVRLGAHPSFPDRANFGRTAMTLSPSALSASVVEQLSRLNDIAADLGDAVEFVKPHGALYHAVGSDPDVAAAFHDAVRGVLGDVPLVLFWKAETRALLQKRGATVLREGFVDRGLDERGFLLPRDRPGALLDAGAAVAQLARVRDDADTLCVHGDGPHALEIARSVRAALRRS